MVVVLEKLLHLLLFMIQKISILCSLLNANLETFLKMCKNWKGSEEELSSFFPREKLAKVSLKQVFAQAKKIENDCRRLGIDILTPLDSHYPFEFTKMENPPIFLNYFGDIELLKKKSLSIVGSRSPLPWVERWIEQQLAVFLAENNIQIASGGAYGIDQLVHRLAIRCGGTSIAILPSGIQQIYPKNLSQFEPFMSRGQWGLLSEYFPAAPMRKHFFYHRNRLISGISPSLFVVQAHNKSGTMMTAKYAIDQGKEVYVLAAGAGEPSMSGNLQLLFDGAHMVRNAKDLNSNFGES